LAARIDFPEAKYSKRGTLRWELIGLEKKRLALGGKAIALGAICEDIRVSINMRGSLQVCERRPRFCYSEWILSD
jgi:hypothetical protein